MSDLTLLGDNKAPFQGLETFPAPAGLAHVVLATEEVSALCPVTGQPDWYKVEARYDLPSNGGKCIESKSFKLYMQTYRQKGIFCEEFACVVRNDIIAATGAAECVVTVRQKPRGGVGVDATAGPWFI